jgi:hypothetical protein
MKIASLLSRAARVKKPVSTLLVSMKKALPAYGRFKSLQIDRTFAAGYKACSWW